MHIIRDGRDVILSHLVRCGYQKAIWATKTWRRSITSARDFAKNVPQDQYYEFRYEDLVENPEDTLEKLFQYLGEPWNSALLEEGSFDIEISARRRIESGETSVIYKSRVGVGQKKLDPFLGALFYYRSGHLMKELGY